MNNSSSILTLFSAGIVLLCVIGKDGTLLYNGAIDDDPGGNKEAKQNYVKACLNEIAERKAITTALTKPYGCTVKY